MADPVISTVTAGFDYQIANTKAMLVGLSLDTTGGPVTITVNFPSAAAISALLVQKSTTTSHDVTLPGTYTFAQRTVTTVTSVIGSTTDLNITVQATGSPSTSEAWILLVKNATPINFEVSVNAGTTPIVRILSDPAVGTGWTALPASPVAENTSVTLTRALDPTTGTVVGTAPGTITFAWSYTGTLAIPALNGSSPSPSRVFTTPGIYGDTTIQISVQPSFTDPDLTAPYTLTNSSAPQPFQIQVRPQYLALVLDRSGSMAIDNRWDNAKTAGRMLVNLFGALRQGVSTDDRIGVLVFEDSHCSWHGIPIDSLIAPIPTLDVEAPGTANSNVCSANFGNYGTCTPIGDALYTAMGRLSSLPNPASGRIPRYTIILLTDGYENSGTIQVGPGPLAPGALRPFSTARLDYGTVNNSMSLYTVGLGHFTDDAVLNALPEPANAGSLGGVYNHIYDVKDLAPSLLEMLGDSQEAQIPTPFTAPFVLPDDPDPDMPTNPIYFDVEPLANRIAIAVTAATWTSGVAGDAIEVAYRTAKNGSNGYTGNFTVLTGSTADCATHGFYTQNLVTALGSGNENNVPGSQWRVRHMKSGVAQPIDSDHMFRWIDLYVKAEVKFDQPAYGTGETMLVTCAISAGNQPVTGAKITVELARPGESLGTFLSVNSKGYQPGRQESADPLAPKPAMLSTLLQQKKMSGLPIIKPPAIFDDGSNQLFDDGSHHDWAAGDGVYANTYSSTDKEGSYMWRFNVQGTLPDGSPFSRLITLATFVGINVSPTVSATQVLFGQPAPAGFQAAQVTIVPKDLKGEYLGPFRPDQVVFTTTAGSFREPYTQFRYDGTYYRTVVYKQGQLPVVTVEVQGKCGQPIIIAKGCLGWLGGLIGRIYLWFVNRAARTG